MAFVATQGATVVDQTTLMKKYLQFVAALTDVNTRELILFVIKKCVVVTPSSLFRWCPH